MDYLAQQAEYLRTVEPLVDNYKPRIDAIEVAAKSGGNPRLGLNDFDKANIAILLDNVDKQLLRYKRGKNLSDRTYSEAVGPYKKHAFNIISAMYATMDIRDIVSFQAMTQKIGAIYRMVYNYASDKGSIRSGDTMFSSQVAGTRSRYYSREIVSAESLTFTFDSTDSTAVLEYYPLKNPTMISMVVTGGAAAGTYTYLSTTSTTYNLQKGTSGTIDATIESLTGIVTIPGVDVGVGTTVITYSWQSEKYSSNVPIPKVTISVGEEMVTAERSQLLIDVMLDTTFDFEKQFGQSLNAQMENTVVQYLQNELAFRVLGEMYDNATGNDGTSYAFDMYPADGQISLSEHAQILFKLLGQMGKKIRTNIGRGIGNRLVTGWDLYNFLKVLDPKTFDRAPVPSGDGPFYAGNLNKDYEVYVNPDLDTDKFFVTYKGDSWWEAAYYIGSYLPLMNSNFLLYPDMHGEQGYISMEALKYEYPLMVVQGSVTDTTP